jgi:hypothetical protein
MSRVVKRPAPRGTRAGPSRRDAPLPQFVPPQLSQPVEKPPSSFAQTQAATDGERGVHLVYYAFDLLHLGGWDVSNLQLIERKALLWRLEARPGP